MSHVEYSPGMKARLSRIIDESEIVLMAQITGDSNPVHLDEEFAKRTRFGGRIAHGLFSNGLISATLGTMLPGPGAIYLRQTLDYLLPVRPGEALTAEVEIVEWRAEKNIMVLKTRCMNAAGQDVARGEAILLVDQRPVTEAV